MAWFSRKPKNRRLSRARVLDVKLRSDQVRATRMRLTVMGLFLACGTLFGFYLLWRAGEWTLNRLVYDNPTFAVRRIDVTTDGVISTNQLRVWAGVKTGQNLLALDLGRVKRDLEMVSAIRSVAVERVMPGTLRLRVSEREPVGQVYALRVRSDGNTESAALQLDGDGHVVSPLDARQRSTPPPGTNNFLPIVRGIDLKEIIPGKRIASQQGLAALQLITAFDSSQMSGLVDLNDVDVSAPDSLQVTTSQRAKITFSPRDLDRQLRRWYAIHEEARRLGKVISTLDLSVTGDVPAVLVAAQLMPPVAPRPRTPQTNRRRNV